jgi:hypothetical protein
LPPKWFPCQIQPVIRTLVMPVSWATDVNVTCPKCARSFTSKAWLIVDAAEQPELLQKIAAGSFNSAKCDCGHADNLLTPLVLDLRREDVPLLVFPQRDAPDGELDEATSHLIIRYFESQGRDPNTGLVERGWNSPPRAYLSGIIKGSITPGKG